MCLLHVYICEESWNFFSASVIMTGICFKPSFSFQDTRTTMFSKTKQWFCWIYLQISKLNATPYVKQWLKGQITFVKNIIFTVISSIPIYIIQIFFGTSKFFADVRSPNNDMWTLWWPALFFCAKISAVTFFHVSWTSWKHNRACSGRRAHPAALHAYLRLDMPGARWLRSRADCPYCRATPNSRMQKLYENDHESNDADYRTTPVPPPSKL